MSVPTVGRPVHPGTPAPSPVVGSRPSGLLGDRRVQLGAGAAVLVVVVALARRGSGGGSASDIAEGTSGGASTADTTATDIEQSISSALGDVYSRLDDISSGLAKPAQQQIPTKPSTPPPSVPAKPTPTNTGPKKPTASGSSSYTIRSGDTLSKIASRNKTTLTRLKALNPGLFDRSHRGGNLIHPGEKVRLR